jgi:ATP-dependent DNA ligase
MDFPTLYSGNRVWQLRVTPDAVIERSYGIQGKTMTTSTRKAVGKNIGKRNQTTAYEQACLEATALFKKQKESGYSETANSQGNNNSPMLAHGFDKHSHKITFPACVQPKLDGVRMLCGHQEGRIVCLSRTGKSFVSQSLIPIVQEIKIPEGVWLDGELYSENLTFEEIVSACRKESSTIPLEYHVYDMIAPGSFEDRYKRLVELVTPWKHVRLVPTFSVDSVEQVNTYHDRFVQEGFEGIMVRNRQSKYAHKRSYDLQKFKNFIDDEFVIVDIKEASGNDEGTAILQCRTEQGECFWVRPRGPRAYRAEILRQKDLLLYKLLTVRYQNMTDKGVPRFPVGIIIRDYE